MYFIQKNNIEVELRKTLMYEEISSSLVSMWALENMFKAYILRELKKITRRTTTSERNKFLQVIASLRKKIQIASNI